MNSLERIKKRLLLICLILLALLFFLVVIPFCIHLLFKWDTGCALLKWEPNTGSMLEFYGAILGGGVTLLVLWITTDETRKIQRKNEEQIEMDRAEKRKNDRRVFVNSVIEDVSKLLANLAHCKDCRLKIAACEKRIKKYEKDLAQVRFQLTQSKKNSSSPFVQSAISMQEMSEKELEQAIQAERNNAIAYYTTKTPSIESIAILNIKLAGIQEAKELINSIVQIMDMEDNDDISFEDFSKEMNKIMRITADFAENYING